MASPGKLQTYQAIGRREDLTDVITNISPVDTFVLSNIGSTDCSQTLHEWQTDELAAAASNVVVEGADPSYTDLGVTTRLGNYTQILSKYVVVSDTQEVVNKAGRKSEAAYQISKKMKELSRDIEYALVVNSTTAAGASGTGRQLKGIVGWIATNNTTSTGTGNKVLTETMYNDNLALIWSQGGQGPMTSLCGAFQKRKFDAWTTNTRYVMADSEKLTSAVNVYESSFGVVTIRLHHQVNTSLAGTVLTLGDLDLWKVAYLRRPKAVEIAKTGDSTKKLIITELTLESRNEKGSGKVTQLTTS